MEELKHSIKTYLLLSAGPTAELTKYLLKLIDFHDYEKEKIESESKILALQILVSIMRETSIYIDGEIRRHRNTAFDLKRSTSMEYCQEELEDLSSQLLLFDITINRQSTLVTQQTDNTMIVAGINESLTAIATILTKLSRINKLCYPTIFTTDGHRLNNHNVSFTHANCTIRGELN
jgi:hypothetical protein